MNKIRNKRPRTPKGLERSKRVTLNLTEPEYLLIKKNAVKAGIPMGTYTRLIALGGQVYARIDEADRNLLREAVNLSNEFHQLAMMARKDGLPNALVAFEVGRNTIDELLNRIKL
jgi:hypothetical protein